MFTQMDLWEMEVTSIVKALNIGTMKSTFADLLQPKPMGHSLLPDPTMSGDFPSIQILEVGYLRGIERYKYSLIGKLDLIKVKFAVARSEAMIKWKLVGKCQFIPLEDVLMSMARTVGNPVQVDSSTLCRNTGFYASVLVDVDFSKQPRSWWNGRDSSSIKRFSWDIHLSFALIVRLWVILRLNACRDVVKEIEQEKVVQNKADKEP
ncbi:hypothetical protein GIB67_005016 [Kingdonia uniflora]|uniref:Uncharacterized protein n=1 Tax=Kingdonia uniflora TaxID=39325 RepID=A0A7J7NNA2_9MAGN|nr:hypothetical protein GIB67_005016 [Kingdonia uniflora]